MCLQSLIWAIEIINSIMSLNACVYCVAVDTCLTTSVKTFFGSKTVSGVIVNYFVCVYHVVNCNVDPYYDFQ